MKILFSNPPWWIKKENGRWRYGCRAGSRWPWSEVGRSIPDVRSQWDYTPYPFFLAYATTYVKQVFPEAEVYFRDSIASRESLKTYLSFLQAGKFDFIFIETSTPTLESDKALINEINIVSPQTKLVLVGPPMAALAQNLIEELPIFAAIKGEYEKNSVKVINGASGVLEFDFLTEAEMNLAPFPYFDETIAHIYQGYGTPDTQVKPVLHLWSSRGCPFKCIFCIWPVTMTGTRERRRVRRYSEESVKGFIKHQLKTYGYNSLHFDDDTMNLTDSHTQMICKIMREIKLPWSAMCRADTISKETWQEMSKSFCKGVFLGFESGSDFVVNQIIQKNLNLQEAAETVKYIRSLGMSVHGSFTLGLPGETNEQIQETLDFIKALPLTSHQISGCGSQHGTELFEMSKPEDFVDIKDGQEKIEELKRAKNIC